MIQNMLILIFKIGYYQNERQNFKFLEGTQSLLPSVMIMNTNLRSTLLCWATNKVLWVLFCFVFFNAKYCSLKKRACCSLRAGKQSLETKAILPLFWSSDRIHFSPIS